MQSSLAWSTSLFDLFLLLSRVVQLIAVGVPEDRLDEGEHVSVAGVPSHLTVLKPDQIVARFFGICFTFEVIARARVDEGLNSADVVISTYQTVGIWSTNDIVVLVED